ncbi:molybdate ABC transporter substrate-binding protein [Corynebacterium falsenii]|uniref:molybdate ABC transporter substrate-binding protein n=1 Tax=Corynebacterium falsenii TaxID=108486 RepID=UPI001CCFFBE5|nr:molybdate ABC transporter substrate-binding protein [Corynebacterium falsenii]UBI07365.1 molybdate ABC transporter substrate-binding protein [Corynebacterium falsenii]
MTPTPDNPQRTDVSTQKRQLLVWILRIGVLVVVLALAIAGLGACSSEDNDSGKESGNGSSSPSSSSTASADRAAVSEPATIFAAASMKPVGDELTAAFTAAYPDASLTWSYGGSSDLVRQIEQGAPADMFISANQKNMTKALATQDFEGAQPHVIATNTLVLALPQGNPGHISSIEDLPGKRVAICAPQVPCGTIAHSALEAKGITLDNPSEEPNVASVSTKVATGEVDAGFMYSTDVKAQADKGVTAIDINGVEPNQYPVALTTRGRDNTTAKAFTEWLNTDTAQQILARYGFTPAT